MNYLDKIIRYYNYYKEYGIKCTTSILMCKALSTIVKSRKINEKLNIYKHNVIIKYIYQHYYIKSYSVKADLDFNSNLYHDVIWTAWLQGEDNAPEIIRLTIASMRKHSNSHRIIVLTDDNINQFIDLPKEILKKKSDNNLSKAHYSDIVRMMVLAKYGGIWLDSTMLLHDSLDESAFLMPFYSVGLNKDNSKYVSNNKWMVGVIGGYAHSRFLKQISNILIMYWTEHDIPIDYFIFDYIIATIFQYDLEFKQIVEQLPKMEFYSTDLRKIINQEYDHEVLQKMFVNKQIYYLTYRNEYQKTTSFGKITYYGYLYNMLLGHDYEKE